MEEEKVEEIKRKMDCISRDYFLDQRELGKITIIVSTTLLIFSAHAAMSFKSAHEAVESSNNELEVVSGVISSGNFQNAMDTIESLNSRALQQQMQAALNAFEGVNDSLERSRQAERDLDAKYRMYQWLALIAILGEVAGFSIILL